MESSITELFEQIIHSEQKAQERKSMLNDVKTEISRCQEEIQKSRDEQTLLQQHFAQAMIDSNEDATRLKCLAAKQKALSSQRQQLMTEDTETERRLNDVEVQIEEKAEKFCQEGTKFSHGYDFCSQGVHDREIEAKKKLEELKEREIKLRSEMACYKSHQKNIELLKKKRKDADRKTKELKNLVEGLEQQVEDQKIVTQDLLMQKEKVADLPRTDPEFLKLQAEMDTLKNDGFIEALHASLQQELQQLQQQVWQSKLKKTRGPRGRPNSQERLEPPVLERQAPHPLSIRPGQPNIPRLSQALKRKKQEEQELIGVGKLLDADGDFEADGVKRPQKEGMK